MVRPSVIVLVLSVAVLIGAGAGLAVRLLNRRTAGTPAVAQARFGMHCAQSARPGRSSYTAPTLSRRLSSRRVPSFPYPERRFAMSTTIVILNVAFATLVVGVIAGMMLWAIKTSPARRADAPHRARAPAPGAGPLTHTSHSAPGVRRITAPHMTRSRSARRPSGRPELRAHPPHLPPPKPAPSPHGSPPGFRPRPRKSRRRSEARDRTQRAP